MADTATSVTHFSELNLPAPLMDAVNDVGYETPSAIQAQAIPHLIEGLDLLGRAPTGTGKTAAFALPLLARIDLSRPQIQIMVLTPTRELAIQVAEAFQRYASHLKGFHVLPVYGGQAYGSQIKQLKRGVHAVVGTPGRIMDHMRKGTLRLDNLQALVLDEADEMLRMGFIDDVEWILEQTPEKHQMALFSATMPREIKRIAQRHLNEPREISIKARTATAETIRQRYWLVSGLHKLDALTRILEVEPFDAILMFVRTKVATTQLAQRLEARGYNAAALNGDMAQAQREQMVNRLKKGKLDILVATDVAARGLDVERISHVINYDIPNGTEAYIHRIGRTGRAGREGQAILFVAPRERRMLHFIERATRQKIERLELPSIEMVSNKRIADFKQQITDTLAAGELEFLHGILEQYEHEHQSSPLEIASALALMALKGKPLLNPEEETPRKRIDPKTTSDRDRTRRDRPRRDQDNRDRSHRDRPGKSEKRESNRREDTPTGSLHGPEQRRVQNRPSRGMERFRFEVGSIHDVKPGNIVGCIASESGLDSRHIGQIDIQDEYSYVDLPKGMPDEVFQDLQKAWINGQRLNISRPDRARKKKQGIKKTGTRRKK